MDSISLNSSAVQQNLAVWTLSDQLASAGIQVSIFRSSGRLVVGPRAYEVGVYETHIVVEGENHGARGEKKYPTIRYYRREHPDYVSRAANLLAKRVAEDLKARKEYEVERRAAEEAADRRYASRCVSTLASAIGNAGLFALVAARVYQDGVFVDDREGRLSLGAFELRDLLLKS